MGVNLRLTVCSVDPKAGEALTPCPLALSSFKSQLLNWVYQYLCISKDALCGHGHLDFVWDSR